MARKAVRPGLLVPLIALIAVLLLARWLLAPDTSAATASRITTPHLVVLGVEARPAVTGADRAVLDAGGSQIGVLRVPTGRDQCAAAGFASLSAGTVVETGTICHPEVTPDGAIADWHELQERAGGRLGTLADRAGGCVAAVGPGAALAATRPDGTVSVYHPFDRFAEDGLVLQCPLTFIAAPGGEDADAVLAEFSVRDDVTVIVAGLGPDLAGARPQLIHRTNTTLPGLLTGRDGDPGSVQLPDLSAALRAFVLDPTASDPPAAQTAPLRVVEGDASAQRAQQLLRDTRNLTDRAALLPAALIAAVVGMALLAGAGLWSRRAAQPMRGVRRVAVDVVAAGATTWPAALLLAGATGWWRTDAPVLFAVLAGIGGLLATIVVALALARWRGWPAWFAGVAVSVLVGVGHAWVGLPWLRGSLLDRDGDASATAAAMATCFVVLLGYLAAAAGRRLTWLRPMGGPWLTLVVAAAGAVVMWLRLGDRAEWTDQLLILLGLAAWTVVHGWLARGPAGPELDLRTLRVPVLLVVIVIAVVSPDPVWAWGIAGLTFASIAAAEHPA